MPNPAKPTDKSVDFAIITALDHERDAVLAQLDAYEPVHRDDAVPTYYRGHISIVGSNDRYEVVVVRLLDMGNDEAATATKDVLHHWDANAVLMVGIAGGVKGRVNLGDVVICDYSYYYEPAKLSERKLEDGSHEHAIQPRHRQFPTDRLLYSRARDYAANDWKERIKHPRPKRPKAAIDAPHVVHGPIGAGEKVYADAEALAALLRDCPKMVAIAMEGAGVARAAANDAAPPRFLEIRGICDFADLKKGDIWHVYAARAAAAFTMGLLRSGTLPRPAAAKVAPIAERPLNLVCAQSLRPIDPAEIAADLANSGPWDGVAVTPLDFMDLISGGTVTDPEAAARRIADPQGVLARALTGDARVLLGFCGLAHIPFAMLAGHIVSDRQSVHLFDFHPTENTGTWAWPEEAGPSAPLEIRGLPQRGMAAGEVIVRISVSYEASEDQAAIAVPGAAGSIDLTVPRPERGIVRSEQQVRQYGRIFREALDALAAIPSVTRVHIFYAGPMALAFHIGQQISANIHPPVVAWNFRRHYEWGIDLAAAVAGEPCIILPSGVGEGS